MTALLAEPVALADDPDLAAEMRDLTDAALADLAGTVLAEPARTELRRRSADRARQRRRQDPATREWHDAAYAQYIAAESACNGYLLSRAGLAKGIDPWPALWTGPTALADHYASEELREFWQANRRVTVTEYRAALRGEEEAYRNDRDRLAHDDAGRIRHEREAGTDQPVRQAGSVRDAGPVRGPGRDVVTGCRHPERPGNGKPVCEDCGDLAKRAAGADRLAELRARAADRRAERAARPAADALAAASVPVLTGTVAVRQPGTVARTSTGPAMDGAKLLDYVRAFLEHFALWPSEAALDAAVAWVAHAHARDASGTLVWQASPRLLFSSAEPGSGKSYAMRLVARLCPAPAVFTEPSEPAVAQAVGKERATLFLDECDVLFGRGARKAAIKALVNDGYSPDGSWARVRGGRVERIPTFGALAMAGLDSIETGTDGHMKATLTRCIRIRMMRGPEGYRPPRWDAGARQAATVLSTQLARWAATALAPLGDVVPEMPAGVGNRNAELWEPLIAAADAASAEWGDRLRSACLEMTTTGALPDDDADALTELDSWFASIG
ncbi:MAG: DUF3631 domain-containing protein [Streptosporangiaceae bacterium]